MASGKIRGITIELTGDTKGLVKSLNSANKSVKDISKSLKDVDKLLEMDPGNVDLIRQKQKLLAEQTDALKEKLKTAEEAMQGFAEAGDSEDNIKAQEALTREIAETQQQIKEAEKAEREFAAQVDKAADAEKDGEKNATSWTENFKNGLSAVSGKLSEIGGKLKDVGKELSAKVTAPIVALGTASIAAFKEVDAGYDIIIKKTGATGEAFEEMKGIFDQIATEVPASMEDIGVAIGEVSTRFDVTGDTLEDLSAKFLKFAQINGTDVENAVDRTQKALAAYGLGAESAGDYLDVMNKVAQNTGVSVDKLAEGIISNGAAFQELGLDINQATVVMGQLEKSGANSETVLNGMRKALKSAAKEGIPLDQALEDLQNTIENGTEGMDGLTAAYELFGKSGDQIYAAVKSGTLDFREFKNATIDAGGSVEDTFLATLDPMDQFTLALQELKLIGAEIGATIGTVIQPVLEALREKLGEIKAWWDSLSPETQDMIVKIAMIAAAIGPLLMLLGSLATAVAALISPVGLVIAAIAAVIAIGILLYKHWDELKEWAAQTWENIKKKVTEIVDNIKTALKEKWDAIKQNISDTIENIKTAIRDKWEAIKTTVSEKVEDIKEKIKEKWEEAKQAVKDKIDGIKSDIKTKWEEIKTTIGNAAQGVLDKILKPFKDAKQKIDEIVQSIKNLFPINISNILSNIKLPHFRLVGSLNPTKWVTDGLPHIEVDWYRKAMQNGMILDHPTIFGMMNGNLLGGGEAGREAIVGVNSLQSMIQQAVAMQISPEMIYEAVRRGASDATIKSYMDGKEVTARVNQVNAITAGAKARSQGSY